MPAVNSGDFMQSRVAKGQPEAFTVMELGKVHTACQTAHRLSLENKIESNFHSYSFQVDAWGIIGTKLEKFWQNEILFIKELSSGEPEERTVWSFEPEMVILYS